MTTTRLMTLLLAGPVLALTGVAAAAHEPDATSPPVRTATGDAGVPTGAGSAAPPSARPVLRVDDTEERRRSLWTAYDTCLLDHGAESPPDDVPVVALGDVAVVHPGPRRAREACRHLEPVQPPALDAATNPDFEQDAAAYVACLRRGGLWVQRLTDDTLDWTYAEGHPVPDGSAETEQQCLVEAFADA